MEQYEWATARAWLEVNLDALENNYLSAKSECHEGAQVIAVLKANAYGMGILAAARFLHELGENSFAVACVSEALEVKKAVPDAMVLVMGVTAKAQAETALLHGISLTVASYEEAATLSAIASRIRITANVHFKLDTGLHRLGFSADEKGIDEIKRAAALPNLCHKGLYSHLALRSKDLDEKQYAAFMHVKEVLCESGIVFEACHLCDSIGMVRYPAWQMNAVRTGAFLYGNTPRGYAHPDKVMPVFCFKTRIAGIHAVEAGECIGYDAEHPVIRPSLIATLSVGYADGFSRSLSEKAYVMIRGKRARVLGLICMDQAMVDITDIPEAVVGDEVTLLGDGISLVEYAEWGHLNRNEVTAVISPRVPRVYLRHGKPAFVADDMPHE